MDNGIETLEISFRQIAKVPSNLGQLGIWGSEIAPGKQIGI
jgi:hypothetical protein